MRAWSLSSSARHAAPTPLIGRVDDGANGCREPLATGRQTRVGWGHSRSGREKVIGEEPIGPIGKPEEIAATVVWLCSDPAAFVVRHAMVIDGGQTA
jgi:NAD(P)-dependent dehydrogenase (short-subunit alcohol dehydrogenase family)